jgi:hypothetical protein
MTLKIPLPLAAEAKAVKMPGHWPAVSLFVGAELTHYVASTVLPARTCGPGGLLTAFSFIRERSGRLLVNLPPPQ